MYMQFKQQNDDKSEILDIKNIQRTFVIIDRDTTTQQTF